MTSEHARIATIIANPSIQAWATSCVPQVVPTDIAIEKTDENIRIFKVKSSNAPINIYKKLLISAYGG